MAIIKNNSELFNKYIESFKSALKEQIDCNESIRRTFMIWKKLGHRISDRDFTTSKQQKRNSIPTEKELKEVFIYENFIAILARYNLILQLNFLETNTIRSFIKVWRELQSDNEYEFLFRQDVFSILLELDSLFIEKISQEMNSLLENVSKILIEMNPDEFISFLYQDILDKRTRKYLGEFYTPKNLVKLMITAIKKAEERDFEQLNILDPSCGAGALLLPLYDFISNINKSCIIGVDINPLAVILSKILIFQKVKKVKKIEEPLIFCADSLLLLKNDKGLESYYKAPLQKIEVHFFNEKITVKLPQISDKNPLILRKEIRKLLSSKQFIKIPESIQDIFDGPNGKFLSELLVDRICVFLLFQIKFDLIIGNPPYMRVQNIHPMWKRQEYKKRFSSAVGHFDLYALFIELGLKLLSEGGKLCYISSNKFMKTTSGIHIRRLIKKFSNIRYLIDFTDSHVFDAMVLPVIYVLEKKDTSERFLYVKIEKQKNLSNILSFDEFIKIIFNEKHIQESITIENEKNISINKFFTYQPPFDEKPWTFLDVVDLDLVEKISKNAKYRTLNDISKKIYVGIKTTANYAFMDDYNSAFFKENREISNENEKIEGIFDKALFLPVIRGKNVRKYRIDWNQDEKGSFIFYPHYKDPNGKLIRIEEDKIPKTINYLKSKKYYDSLNAREYIKEAGRLWYEIWNPKDPDLMLSPLKIITPDISPVNNFALDDKQFFIDGSSYIILLKDESRVNYEYVLGILNSKVAEYYHKCKSSNQLYAGRYRYFSTNIRYIPIPEAEKKNIEKISILVKKLIKNPTDKEVERELNHLVYEIVDLTQDNIHYIEKWLELQKSRLK